MTLLTNPPEWNAPGVEPPQTKKDEGWDVGERPPAPWMNWWMHRTFQSLREIAQAFVGHRDATSGVHGVPEGEDIETVSGAQAKADAALTAAKSYTDTHPRMPTTGEKAAMAGTAGTPGGTNRYVTNSDSRLSDARAPLPHSHGAADLPKATTSAQGIVQLSTATNSTATDRAATPSAVKAAYDLAADAVSSLDGKASFAVFGGLLAGNTSSPAILHPFDHEQLGVSVMERLTDPVRFRQTTDLEVLDVTATSFRVRNLSSESKFYQVVLFGKLRD